MRLTRSRARSIGWAMTLAVCFALTIALAFKVNSVKSQVRLTERRIAALRTEKSLLETEFETRANQQQLTALNEVEFGYQAPTAGQYLENERQLAALGKPRGPGAPQMIRVAANDGAQEDSGFPPMVNPLTGKAMAAEAPHKAEKVAQVSRKVTPITGPAGLVERLSFVEKQPRAIDKGLGKAAEKTERADTKLAAKAPGKPKVADKAKGAGKAAAKPKALAKSAKGGAKTRVALQE